jgi:Rhodopirellula transposase DDE domain
VLSTLLILLGFIRHTTTTTGLNVTATHFDRTYQTGLKVSKSEFKALQLTRHDVCPVQFSIMQTNQSIRRYFVS